MDYSDILKAHAAAYPKLQPTDAVKLIYQSTFGGGHMLSDEASVLARLRSEYASVFSESSREVSRDGGRIRFESLGDSSRVYLGGADSTDLYLIARMFIASAKAFAVGYADAEKNVRESFLGRLQTARGLAADGLFGFTAAEFDSYLAGYAADGYPAVSHSDIYREAYKPAYRVIASRFVRLYPLLRRVAALLDSRRPAPVVLAIDGRCASGKTTAAKLIAEVFGSVEIVHTDDFFLPPELRTSGRLAEAGGNLHRERFMDEVVRKLRDPDGFAYRVFDCRTKAYSPEPRRIAPAKLIICEGAYALHPDFGNYYDLAAFSTIAPAEQERRILERNGAAMLGRFRSMWIPMEERYFEAFGIGLRCDITVE